MKFLPPACALRICLFCLLPVLSGCGQWDGQINSLKNEIETGRASNNQTETQLMQVKRNLTAALTKVNAQTAQRKEFEAKAAKSSATEQTFIKYRGELETSLKEFKEAVDAYRAKYITPEA